MNLDKFRGVCQQAVQHYGEEPQKRQAIEECSELIQALCKDMRGKKHNVEEEIADVFIMIEQLTCIYDNDKIEKYREKKIDRLIDMMRKNSRQGQAIDTR